MKTGDGRPANTPKIKGGAIWAPSGGWVVRLVPGTVLIHTGSRSLGTSPGENMKAGSVRARSGKEPGCSPDPGPMAPPIPYRGSFQSVLLVNLPIFWNLLVNLLILW